MECPAPLSAGLRPFELEIKTKSKPVGIDIERQGAEDDHDKNPQQKVENNVEK